MGIMNFINRHERIKVIWESIKQNSIGSNKRYVYSFKVSGISCRKI